MEQRDNRALTAQQHPEGVTHSRASAIKMLQDRAQKAVYRIERAVDRISHRKDVAPGASGASNVGAPAPINVTLEMKLDEAALCAEQQALHLEAIADRLDAAV